MLFLDIAPTSSLLSKRGPAKLDFIWVLKSTGKETEMNNIVKLHRFNLTLLYLGWKTKTELRNEVGMAGREQALGTAYIR